jgi:hypothetical protein
MRKRLRQASGLRSALACGRTAVHLSIESAGEKFIKRWASVRLTGVSPLSAMCLRPADTAGERTSTRPFHVKHDITLAGRSSAGAPGSEESEEPPASRARWSQGPQLRHVARANYGGRVRLVSRETCGQSGERHRHEARARGGARGRRHRPRWEPTTRQAPPRLRHRDGRVPVQQPDGGATLPPRVDLGARRGMTAHCAYLPSCAAK